MSPETICCEYILAMASYESMTQERKREMEGKGSEG
jgi:hypothetical protein